MTGDVAGTGVVTERRGSAFLVGLDRPEKRNAIDQATVDLLHEALDEAARGDPCVVVVHSTTPGMFVAGADIGELIERRADDAFRAINAGLFERLEGHRWPTVAVVDGPALGGGCELALACDLRVASTRRASGNPNWGSASSPAPAATGGWLSWSGWGPPAGCCIWARSSTPVRPGRWGWSTRCTSRTRSWPAHSTWSSASPASPGALSSSPSSPSVKPAGHDDVRRDRPGSAVRERGQADPHAGVPGSPAGPRPTDADAVTIPTRARPRGGPMTIRRLTAMVLAAALVAAGCGGDDDDAAEDGAAAEAEDIAFDFGVTEDTIRVGLLADLSGPFSVIIADIAVAQQAYFDQVNADGRNRRPPGRAGDRGHPLRRPHPRPVLPAVGRRGRQRRGVHLPVDRVAPHGEHRPAAGRQQPDHAAGELLLGLGRSRVRTERVRDLHQLLLRGDERHAVHRRRGRSDRGHRILPGRVRPGRRGRRQAGGRRARARGRVRRRGRSHPSARRPTPTPTTVRWSARSSTPTPTGCG